MAATYSTEKFPYQWEGESDSSHKNRCMLWNTKDPSYDAVTAEVILAHKRRVFAQLKSKVGILLPNRYGEPEEIYQRRCASYSTRDEPESEYWQLTRMVQEFTALMNEKKKADDEAISKAINKLYETPRNCPVTLTPIGGWKSLERGIRDHSG